MSFKPLYVTGMFRSGTTILAKILNAHPNIALASDPFLPFLKDLRDDLAAARTGDDCFRPQGPLGDYFCDFEQLLLLRDIWNTTLDRPFDDSRRPSLWPVIKERGAPFSQHLVARMDELKGGTYAEIYADMLRLTAEVYGEGEPLYAGHKEVWSGEFTLPLHRSFADLKSIHIVRDPRAMCASKNVAEDKYPWLFLIRHWRKMASMAWLAVNAEPGKRSALLLRYEDLIDNPELICRMICEFLEIDFDARMLMPERLQDGDGTPWKRNSSYDDLACERSVTNKGYDRWKTVLAQDEVSLIERLTFPLSEIFGYSQRSVPGSNLHAEMLLNAPQVRQEQLTPWIAEYVKVDPTTTACQMGQEAARLAALSTSVSLPTDLVDSMFYDQRLFSLCRDFTV